jgi:hypothetical protein
MKITSSRLTEIFSYLGDNDPVFTGTLNNQTNSANLAELTGIDFTLCYTKVIKFP